MSTAAHLISKTTGCNQGYIIDGGYFENYGAQTALELARKAIDVIDPDRGQPNHQNLVKLVILLVLSLRCAGDFVDGSVSLLFHTGERAFDF